MPSCPPSGGAKPLHSTITDTVSEETRRRRNNGDKEGVWLSRQHCYHQVRRRGKRTEEERRRPVCSTSVSSSFCSQNHPHQNFHAIIMIIINQRSHHCHRVMEKMLHRCWLVIPSSPNAADFLRCIIRAAGTRTLWFIDASLHLKGNIKQIDSNGHLRCRWSKCKNNTNHSQSASVTQSCKVFSM